MPMLYRIIFIIFIMATGYSSRYTYHYGEDDMHYLVGCWRTPEVLTDTLGPAFTELVIDTHGNAVWRVYATGDGETLLHPGIKGNIDTQSQTITFDTPNPFGIITTYSLSNVGSMTMIQHDPESDTRTEVIFYKKILADE
ncbi:MAG: hypothetical protein HC898_02845 [Phycisphaerales bacterium]|nr:hypothetical protein [Phycisphaerales bacterium]